MSLLWNDLDDRAVTTAKLLAADAVEKAGSGHPGTPISLAAAAYLLFQRHLNFDPQDDRWLGRDRFILSAGHASLLQYVQLYLAGAGIELEDLQALRTEGSITPGHPEFRHTRGIELTTGPLGTGLAASVGFAMSARRSHGMFDPETPMGESVFDHQVWVITGDGCMEEGVGSEAASLAGTQELGNLNVLYDSNRISIEDDTNIAFTEDVLARFRAYGWDVQQVNWLADDGSYSENVEALDAAMKRAEAETSKPSVIALRTIIGWPTPVKQGTGDIHGAKLGDDSLRGLKLALGQDPDARFDVDQEAVDHARQNAAKRGKQAREAWEKRFEQWRTNHPDRATMLDRIVAGQLPEGFDADLPTFEEGKDLATRKASEKVIQTLADTVPELWGGSADLAGSTNTIMAKYPSFLPDDHTSKKFPGNPFGRNLHFGVREFGMGAIMNGIAADGLSRVYGATFFVFSDFMRGAVRLAAIMDLPVIYVWTHDSVGVGEDGPTHQPVEHLAAYRAIPNLSLVRPADAAETVEAWRQILKRPHPAGLILTRQNIPNPARGGDSGLADASGLARGAYMLADTPDTPDVILMASGSEVSVALAARQQLAEQGVQARVVSVPCMEWFEEQDAEYRNFVLPPSVRARVSVEATIAMPWYPYLGEAGRAVSLEHYGVSADGPMLLKEYGFNPENVVSKALESMEAALH